MQEATAEDLRTQKVVLVNNMTEAKEKFVYYIFPS